MRTICFLFVLGLGLTGCAPTPEQMMQKLDDGMVNMDIQKKVTHNWVVPNSTKVNEMGTIVVNIKLNADATLQTLTVTQSSGNLGFDVSLIRAIRKSFPLPIPPNDIGKYRDFDMMFTNHR